MKALMFFTNRDLKFRGCIGRSFFASMTSALLLSAATAQAATITVTSGNDSGVGTLRQAILNSSSGGTINFAAGITTVILTSGVLVIDKNLTINGPGSNLLTVQRSASARFRIFDITATSTATISGLKISGGSTPSIPQTRGGGISCLGTLTISNCAISGNRAAVGLGGDVNSGYGGGFYNAGSLTIINSTVSGNSAAYSAGGLENWGSATIINSTISGNSCGDATSAANGGGISNAGVLTITNSTISGNSAISAIGGGGTTGGGGIFNTGTVTARNTIIALNTCLNGPDFYGTLTSDNFNLIGNNAGTTITPAQPADQIGTLGSPIDPLLGPLQNNGGPTFTHALQSGSPAIDKGHSSGSSTDQRGVLRPVDQVGIVNASGGDGSDMGAFEFGPIAVPRGDFNGDSFTDYLLFNSSTRRTAIWNLQRNAFLGGIFGPTVPAGWVVGCVADVNRDSKPDYVLFNASTRRTAVWFLNNATFLSSVYGPTLPPGWTLVSAVDINHDGRPDYVLFNPTTRQTAAWFLTNTTFTGAAYGPTLPAGWTLSDALDFNGNGRADFLLFNPSTRQTALWFLNGTAFVSGVLGPTPPSGWTLQGAADFNADANPDYVLYQASTRRTALWYLNGVTFAGSAYGPTLPAGYTLASP